MNSMYSDRTKGTISNVLQVKRKRIHVYRKRFVLANTNKAQRFANLTATRSFNIERVENKISLMANEPSYYHSPSHRQYITLSIVLHDS